MKADCGIVMYYVSVWLHVIPGDCLEMACTHFFLKIQEEKDALRVAERILQFFQEPWLIGEHTFQMTSSIGIAFYSKDGITSRELMKHADVALYVVKDKGRNNVHIYLH